MASLTFQQLVAVYRAIEFDPGSTEGYVRVINDDQVELLKMLLSEEHADDTALTVLDGDPDNLAIGSRLRLRAGQPRIALGLFLKDVPALLEAARVTEPARYFIAHPKFYREDVNPPKEVTAYRSLLTFVALLKEAAAYLDASTEELIFVRDGRFSVPVRFELQDLEALQLETLQSLTAKFTQDAHRDQKLSILSNAIYDLAASVKPDLRFRQIMTRINELESKFTDGYKLFSSSFSYDKVKGDIQDAKIDFTSKIHKTVTDIQNQILAIPVATVIVATQMKHAVTYNAEFWINSGVLAGCWIFVILTFIMLHNQYRTLGVIDNEVTRQERKMASDYKSIADMFHRDFSEIHDRIRTQRTVLWIIAGIVILGFVATHIVYFQLWELRK